MDRFVDRFKRDRRLVPRHDLKTPVRVRVRRHDSREWVAQSENLSTNGVFVETDLPISAGAALDLFFEMPESVTGTPAAHWLCLGHVVRVVQGDAADRRRGVGVQFDCYELSRTGKPQAYLSEVCGQH